MSDAKDGNGVALRRYDGLDYRYSSDDADRRRAVAIIGNLLCFQPRDEGLAYSLNFFSGGIGVNDRLAIRCQIAASDWPAVIAKLQLKPIAEILIAPTWLDEVRWLVGGDDAGDDLAHDCMQFINSKKLDFQDCAGEQCEVFFANESDVNSWCVIWSVNGNLNCLSFDQG